MSGDEMGEDRRAEPDEARAGAPGSQGGTDAVDPSGVSPGSERSDEAPPAAESIEALRARIEELEDKLLRARAEIQNVQRRSAQEQTEAVRYANASLMRTLVNVLDDFERSLNAGHDSDTVDTMLQGVRLIHGNLHKALAEQGLEAIEALRRPFDPALHEALMRQPSSEHPEGTVINEIARGYRLHDRVIRPSRVIVSTHPAAAGESERAGGPA